MLHVQAGVCGLMKSSPLSAHESLISLVQFPAGIRNEEADGVRLPYSNTARIKAHALI